MLSSSSNLIEKPLFPKGLTAKTCASENSTPKSKDARKNTVNVNTIFACLNINPLRALNAHKMKIKHVVDQNPSQSKKNSYIVILFTIGHK
ncbi:MAG: hypothetical protein BWZ03_00644 [bacterium ADurb.BinA186]|nr:MAG: hypothetical protein BWZ03_00644 [bacterium ADurb.BinA186]